MSNPSLDVQRVRHPLKMRLLTVVRTRLLTPQLLSVTFGGDDLADFVSASFDDHVKLFFPLPGESEPLMPSGPPGARTASETVAQPVARDYTPHRYDAALGELEILFVLHDAGPASGWAAQARAGDRLGIGGPRGSFVIPDGYDWFWMIGDATALPAIARRLGELPAGRRVTVILSVEGGARIELPSRADVDIVWLDGGGSLPDAVAAMPLPAGEGYVWAAGAASAMRALHHQLVHERGLPKQRIRAASYWKRGAANVHESLGD
jgi:NADPH-dependent ferric siderophore reductase